MDFSFNEEQEALRELARKILGDLVTPDRLGKIEASGAWFDRELWSELAKANLLGVGLSEEQGGSGWGLFAVCLLLQEQGRAVAPLPLHGTLIGARAIERFGSEEQKRAWLPGVVSGETCLGLALSDEGNDDLARPTARVRGGKLQGRKANVSSVAEAARLLVTASDEHGAAGVFLVDPKGPGVSLERQTATSREPVWWIDFDGAPAEPLQGASAAWLGDHAVTGLCAVQLGVSERALEMTAAYGREREQFDRPIGSFQAFHTRAADAFVNLEAMRLTLWQAAFLLDEDREVGDAVDVAKFWACEGGQFVGYAAQHLHGGIGMDIDYPLHRYYMWAKHLELSLGSAQRSLLRIGTSAAN